MAAIFTQRIWQPCICQPNELKREIKKKKWGWQTGGQAKIWGAMAHPPLESPLALDITATQKFQRSPPRCAQYAATEDILMQTGDSCCHENEM